MRIKLVHPVVIGAEGRYRKSLPFSQTQYLAVGKPVHGLIEPEGNHKGIFVRSRSASGFARLISGWQRARHIVDQFLKGRKW
jgi:hypothetical protein